MSQKEDLASIKEGERLAAIDIAAKVEFEEGHHAHHAADPSWDCTLSNQAFYTELGWEAKGSDDLILKGAYARALNRWVAEQPTPEQTNNPFNFIPLTLNGDESPEEVQAKIKQAIEDDIALRQMQHDAAVLEQISEFETDLQMPTGPEDEEPVTND